MARLELTQPEKPLLVGQIGSRNVELVANQRVTNADIQVETR